MQLSFSVLALAAAAAAQTTTTYRWLPNSESHSRGGSFLASPPGQLELPSWPPHLRHLLICPHPTARFPVPFLFPPPDAWETPTNWAGGAVPTGNVNLNQPCMNFGGEPFLSNPRPQRLFPGSNLLRVRPPTGVGQFGPALAAGWAGGRAGGLGDLGRKGADGHSYHACRVRSTVVIVSCDLQTAAWNAPSHYCPRSDKCSRGIARFGHVPASETTGTTMSLAASRTRPNSRVGMYEAQRCNCSCAVWEVAQIFFPIIVILLPPPYPPP